MNAFNVAVSIAVIGGYLLIRHWAARKVAGGQGRAAWLLFGLPLFGFAVVIWSGVILLPKNPLLGVGFILTGVLLTIGLALGVHRASVGVSQASTPDDRISNLLDAFQSYQVLLALVILIGALLAVVAIIAVGLSTR